MSHKQLGFVFDPSSCTQCQACEVACKTWRGLEQGVAWRKVLNIWDGKYPDIQSETLSISCLHCQSPACIPACPTGAIQKDTQTGTVLVDPTLCTGCRKCQIACPYDVPQFGQDNRMQKCDLCTGRLNGNTLMPPCVHTCPNGALALRWVDPAEQVRLETSTLKALNKSKLS